MKRHLLIALLLILTSTFLVGASGRSTLKGLKHFNVVIEDLEPAAEQAGLSRDRLKTDVELRLRRARLPVAEGHQDAFLYVHISVERTATNGLAYCVRVSLAENAVLARDKAIFTLAETWKRAGIGVTPSSDFVSEARQAVGDQVDDFINDYLAANP